MSMTITGSDLYRFQRLVAKLIKSSDTPTISFIPHEGNLKLCGFAKDAMLTMSVSRAGFLDPFAMQWRDFKSLATAKKQDVIFNLTKDSIHVLHGEEHHWFTACKKVNTIPNQPQQTSTHQKSRLLAALNEATCCVDKDGIKYACEEKRRRSFPPPAHNF